MKKLFSKRVLSCLLALSLVVGMIPLGALSSAAFTTSASSATTQE